MLNFGLQCLFVLLNLSHSLQQQSRSSGMAVLGVWEHHQSSLWSLSAFSNDFITLLFCCIVLCFCVGMLGVCVFLCALAVAAHGFVEWAFTGIDTQQRWRQSLTHNLLLDIKYEPRVCEKSPEIWQISFFRIKHWSFRYLWKAQEEQAEGSNRMWPNRVLQTVFDCAVDHSEFRWHSVV